MFDTLIKSLHLKITYKTNSFIYAIKQIPGLRRLLSDRLYSVGWLKALIMGISVLHEIIMTFAGKFIYAGVLIVLPALTFDPYEIEDMPWAYFMHIFLFLTLVGGMVNNAFMEGSMDKYYAIFLMRMDAKKYTISHYAYFLLRCFMGFLLLGLIGTFIMDAPLWWAILIPLYVVMAKLLFTAIDIKKYEIRFKSDQDIMPRKKAIKLKSGNGVGYISLLMIILFLIAAYIPAIRGVVLQEELITGIMIAIIIAGSVSTVYIKNFRYYRKAYQVVTAEFLETQALVTDANKTIQQNRIENVEGVSSNKSGFEFLNELFVKRHRKILWRSSRNIMIILGAVFLILLLLIFVIPDAKKEINRLINNNLRVIAFIMYIINRGQSYTQALFANCDHSLLNYPAYRKGSNILKLFRLRLIEISKVNILPALSLGVGLAMLLFLSGGTENPLYYLVVVLSVVTLSIFFSVHYLTMYYLLQPYNGNTEMKSGLYSIIMGLTYVVCYMLLQIDGIPAMGFGVFTSGFCVVYSIIACILAYYLAPKTFKIRY